MNELILEVEDIIRTQKLLIERNKKYHEYPFMNDCDHFYRFVLLHKTLEVWEKCLRCWRGIKKNVVPRLSLLRAIYSKKYFRSKIGTQVLYLGKRRLKLLSISRL